MRNILGLLGLGAALLSGASVAGGKHQGGVHDDKERGVLAAFDIVHARITSEGRVARFHMSVAGKAGGSKPTPSGQLAGSEVFSYVWPTTIDSYAVGFEKSAGILALAVTAHPDFDDTPLFDENGDQDKSNDGDVWHSHWVVLKANEECGPGALAVVDIPEGVQPRLPKTWPGLPILLDSPGWQPTFNEDAVEVRVAFDDSSALAGIKFDGVAAGLRVNQSVHAPLLCVVDVKDIASDDLSLPGTINQ